MAQSDVSFRVAKDDFAHAVSWVARNLPQRPSQPVLRAILISADDQGLELSGFDYEISTRVRIPAEVDSAGTVAVAGKLLAEIVANLPNKPVDLRTAESTVVVSCGAARFELPVISLDDYPTTPALPATTGTIDPHLFVEAISQVAPAAGRDETLPMLTGVNFEFSGSTIKLAATDRFRLAIRTVEWEPTDAQLTARLLVPAKSLQDNARSLDSHSQSPVEIAVGSGDTVGGEGLFGLHAQNRETTTRMLDAEFPTVDPLIPKSHTSIATIEVAPLLEALRRVSLLTDRNAQIRMQFSPGQLILSAGGSDTGNAEETIPAAFAGVDDFITAFNPNYLRESLSVFTTDRVLFGFNEPSRPAIIIPAPEELPEAREDGSFESPQTDFLYLLMPVRLPG